MSEEELKAWAESHAPAGSAVAVAVLKLFEKLDSYRNSATVLDRALHENGYVTMPPVDLGAFLDWLQQNPVTDERTPVGFDGSTGTPETIMIDWPEDDLALVPRGGFTRTFDGSKGTPESGKTDRIGGPPPGSQG